MCIKKISKSIFLKGGCVKYEKGGFCYVVFDIAIMISVILCCCYVYDGDISLEKTKWSKILPKRKALTESIKEDTCGGRKSK